LPLEGARGRLRSCGKSVAIHREPVHATATTTIAITWGRKITVRKNVMPRTFARFRIAAMTSPTASGRTA
jgi:hypothetical protein